MSVGREFEGKDVTDALEAAAAHLDRPAASLRYEVVEEGRRGLFGLGSKPVRIWVELPPDQAARHEADVMPPSLEAPPDQRAIEGTCYRMFHLMGLELKIRTSTTADGLRLELAGPDRRMLVHRDGELLTAFQFLLNRMGRRAWPGAGRIQLVCDGWHQNRDQDVVELARQVATQVVRTGQTKLLHPMNPYERRLVHITVKEFPGLTSASKGDGFLKQVTVLQERGGLDEKARG